ncbi:MAG: hypothetical protein AAF213_12715 [Pseudomonadota bacterium]
MTTLSGDGSAADVPRPFLSQDGEVSPSFLAAMDHAIQEIEPNARHRLEGQGFQFLAVPTMETVAPKLMDRDAGAYNEIPTLTYATAFTQKAEKRALVAERIRIFEEQRTRRFQAKQWRPNDRVRIAVHHEAGHMIDFSLDDISQSPLFIKAHEQDVATLRRRMRRRDQGDIAYFTSRDKRGRQEAFAEQWGQGHGAPSVDHDLAVLMPATAKFVSILQRNIAAGRYPYANLSERNVGIKTGLSGLVDRGVAILFPMPEDRLATWRLQRRKTGAGQEPAGSANTTAYRQVIK